MKIEFNSKLLLFIGAILFIILPTVSSQDGYDIVVDVEMFRIGQLAWSADSQMFTFINSELTDERPLPELAQPGWQSFDLATQTLSSGTTVWPLQPNLTSAEQAILGSGQFVWAFPSDDLLLFGQVGSALPADLANQSISRLAIINRQTGEIASTDILSPAYRFEPQRGPRVYWDASGSTVVVNAASIGTAGQISKIFHVEIPDINDLQSMSVQEFDGTLFNGIPYVVYEPPDDLLDLSHDGNRVLLIGRDADFSPSRVMPPRLIIWTPTDSTTNRFVDAFDPEQVCEAAFAPNSNSQIVVLTDDGRLTLYDLQSEQAANLHIGLEPNCAFRKLFSPDGRWLAMLIEGHLTFLDNSRLLNETPLVFSHPPVADAGPDQYILDTDLDGLAHVTLDGTNSSDAEGTVVSYLWRWHNQPTATGATPQLDLPVGTHTITLTVTDEEGLSDTDEVVIEVTLSIDDMADEN